MNSNTKSNNLSLVDTHCHIQFSDYGLDPEEVWQSAKTKGVTKMLAVGCDLESSIEAIEFARTREGVYAVVGVHPHYASQFLAQADNIKRLEDLLVDAKRDKIVGIGEFGLDYYYENSVREDQIKLLKIHLELVAKYDLPACFHIRDAFDDFWPVFDEFYSQKLLKGVVHSFTATEVELTEALKRGLYVAFNGIMTFTRDENQLKAAEIAPLGSILLETDAPYLTPKPFRGKICKPEHIVHTATFLAGLRGESIEELSKATTNNANKLFKLR